VGRRLRADESCRTGNDRDSHISGAYVNAARMPGCSDDRQVAAVNLAAVRILVVTNLFEPDRGGGASVFTDLLDGLAQRGHDVDVQTTYPYYPEWVDKSGKNGLSITREHRGPISVARYGMYIPRDPSSVVQRLVQELTFLMSLCRGIHLHRQADVVIVFCPLISAVTYAAIRRILKHEFTLINVQDIPADAAAAGGLVHGRVIKRLAAGTQRFLFRRAQLYSSIAPAMVARVAEITGRPERVHLLPNHLNESMKVLIEGSRSRSSETIVAGREIRLLYAGNIGGKQNLLGFCESIAASEENFLFRIFGSGSEAETVREWVAKRGDSRFEMGPFLPEADFVDALTSHDAFVITETPDAGASFIPSKLIPAISAGIPIVAVADPTSPLATEVANHELGIVVEWQEPLAGLERLSQLLTDHDRRRLLGATLERRAADYSREESIDRLESLLMASLAGQPSKVRSSATRNGE